MAGIALTMPAASLDGLLAFGRRIGFSVASAATHNGALADAGGAAQVDSLTASLITRTVREPCSCGTSATSWTASAAAVRHGRPP